MKRNVKTNKCRSKKQPGSGKAFFFLSWFGLWALRVRLACVRLRTTAQLWYALPPKTTHVHQERAVAQRVARGWIG
jgi:hypothetical protein